MGGPRAACILTIDDSPSVRRAISAILHRAGFRVLEAATGEEGLARMEARPDLVILDVELPDMRGPEVCRLIKANPLTAHTPVLEISAARVTTGDQVQGLEQGADAYLPLPVDPGVLVATVRCLLRMRTALDRVDRLHALTAALAGAATPGHIAELTLEHAMMATGADGGAVALLEGGGTSLEIMAEAGGRRDWLATPTPADPAPRRIPAQSPFPLTICAWTGEPIWIETSEVYAASYPHLARAARESAGQARGGAVQALAAVPLLVEGRAVGGLALVFSAPRAFSEPERAFLTTVAQHGAHALERARLLLAERETRERAEQAMIQERAARREAEESRAHLEAVLRQMPAGLLIAGAPAGELRFVNPQIEAIWGAPLALGALPPAREGYRPDGERIPEGGWPLDRALRGEVVTREEICVRRGGAVERVERVSAAPIRTGEGRLLGAVAVVEEITQEKEIEEALRRSSRAREEIIAVVSHDLRNPLNLVTMGGAIIQRQAPPGEAGEMIRKQADRILRAAERMNGLIRDLLDAATIEAGGFRVEVQRQPLHTLVNEALEAVAPLARAKSIELQREAADVIVECDHDRVLQALVNLLTNAVKFTPELGVIRVSGVRRDAGVVLSVTDTGPGVPLDQQPRLFDRYVRQSRTTGGGTGLGLYIAKAIVEAHGGAIWLDSRPGMGATFSFSLPRACAGG